MKNNFETNSKAVSKKNLSLVFTSLLALGCLPELVSCVQPPEATSVGDRMICKDTETDPYEVINGVNFCIVKSCEPGEEDITDDGYVCEETKVMDAGPDTSETVDAGPDTSETVDACPDTSETVDAGPDTSETVDAGPDTSETVDAGPDMNPCNQAMYDSANQLLGILSESKQTALGVTRYVGGGYGNYTFTCAGTVSEIFEGTVLNSADEQVKVLQVANINTGCNSYWEFTPGNLGTRSITNGWQSVVTPSYVEVIEHGFFPNTQSSIPNQQAITLTMKYDRNTQEIDGQPLCPELVTDIENQL